MVAQAKKIVERLASIRLADVFNPYSDTCTVHDTKISPSVRRKNLEEFIIAALARGTKTVWIGRDLGYRGGRRTGLPLTDEANLRAISTSFKTNGIEKATKTDQIAERTAAEIWRVISELETPPFLWNAFPLHPHEPGDGMSNRCHSKSEFKACVHIFHELMNLFQFEKVYALGNDAAKAMELVEAEVVCIRHPSYGGQTEFRRRMATEYMVDVRQAELVF